MLLEFDLNDTASYARFLQAKRLPMCRFVGRTANIPDEYAHLMGCEAPRHIETEYVPRPGLFDYQDAISRLAIRKRKFAVFADCGLGKTLILLEFAGHAARVLGPRKCVLIVSPLMVVDQTIAEARTFYGDDLAIQKVASRDLSSWLANGSGIGITNYEALRGSVQPGRLGALILDESSLLKSHYGKFGAECIRLGKGLDWKLALTGTPAPNDRIEYANHAVFLDAFPTVNSFLARYFVNRGQTNERWEMKPHAIGPFYRALSHWCFFLASPSTYGWRDNADTIPPIHVHIHDIDLTREQVVEARALTGTLFPGAAGGITTRSKMGRLAKGRSGDRAIPTNKPGFIRDLVNSWPGESTIIWCKYNDEQEMMEREFPEAASIAGPTPHEERIRLIDDFKAGRRRTMISKGKVLGFGLNLQVATRMVFSGLEDSYETFHQCVKRANRVGSFKPLDVHIPVTDLERPMIATVLRKAHRVESDTREQERIFKRNNIGGIV